MVNRTSTNIPREINEKSSNHSFASRSQKNKLQEADDIIMSLSDAHENKRAQQVFEWQRLQPRNIRLAV